MPNTICDTFRALAMRTHDHLVVAEQVNHQPLEETFTDLNILQLMARHRTEIFSRVFNKRSEGANGADWEWWLTNAGRSRWLGLRIQAKVLHLSSDTFRHLHYKSGNPSVYQLAKLERESLSKGLVPLYCFYVRLASSGAPPSSACGSFPYAPEYYGCSLTSIEHVQSLQSAGHADDLAAVMTHAAPWHCLVCCSGFGGNDLPSRAWQFLLGFVLNLGSTGDRTARDVQYGPRERPPSYVLATLKGNEMEDVHDAASRGLVVIAPREDD